MGEMIRRCATLAGLALAALAVGCGPGAGDEGAATDVASTPVPTLGGVGSVPESPPPDRQAIVRIPAPVNLDGTAAALIGDLAAGNRILLIGDSILASTAQRYGGQMCDQLVPLGWEVAVEAEPSRFIDFGNRVLDRMLDEEAEPADDWHAAVVFLGSNYGGDEVRFEGELRVILERLDDRPTLLFTVTEYRDYYAEVNEVVRRLAAEYDNVTIIDWEAISAYPGVLSSDRLHPTETGREVLAQAVAGALGPALIGEGDCLRPQFRNDSAINRGGGGGSSVGGTGGTVRTTTTTTVRPTTTTATATTVTGGGSGGATTTTTGGGTGGVTTTTAPSATTTAATTTAAPTTAPSTTSPTAPTVTTTTTTTTTQP
jgi:hypothetical protein